MSDKFKELGLQMPTTNAEFKKLIASIDQTTPAGQKLFGTILSLNGAFFDLTSKMNELQSQVDSARSALADSYQKEVNALNQAKSNLVSAYNTEKSAIQQTIEKMGSLGKTLRAFVTNLSTSTASPGSPESRYLDAKALYQSTFSAASSGDATAQSQMQSVAQAFLDASKLYNASSTQYGQDYQMVQVTLSQLASQAEQASGIAQQQLDTMTQQVSQLVNLNSSSMSVNQAILAVNASQQSLQSTTQSVADALLKMGLIDQAAYAAMVNGGSSNADRIIAAINGKAAPTTNDAIAGLIQAVNNLNNSKPTATGGTSTVDQTNAANAAAAAAAALDAAQAQQQAAYQAERAQAASSFESQLNTANSKAYDLSNKAVAAYNAGYTALAADFLANSNAYKKQVSSIIDQINASAYSLGYVKTGGIYTVNLRARGGMTMGPTIVGEEGPELIDFPSPVNVQSNGQTRSTLSGLAEAIQSSDANQARANRAQIRVDQEGYQALIKVLTSIDSRLSSVESKTKLAGAA